jgi:mannose-1-phosphate guanylyltransferase
VVDAGDSILVLPKDKSQDVRKVVEALKAKKLTAFL